MGSLRFNQQAESTLRCGDVELAIEALVTTLLRGLILKSPNKRQMPKTGERIKLERTSREHLSNIITCPQREDNTHYWTDLKRRTGRARALMNFSEANRDYDSIPICDRR